MIYRSADDLDFTISSLPAVPVPGRVLMTTPAHFQVRYVINPHMKGNVGDVDVELAREQWDSLRAVYEAIGIPTSVVEGVSGLPDMVFCANQTLPYRRSDGRTGIVPSLMYAPERRDEVSHYRQFFASIDYEITPLPNRVDEFEGCGDALWVPGRQVLLGGYGFRTDEAAYEFLSEELETPIVSLNLSDPDFYHLDTCLCLLDAETVLIYPGAFDDDGLELIQALFETVIEAPEDEARTHFAVNAHCPDARHVILPEQCDVTAELLSDFGFMVIEVDTGEYIKSGGSVFCMKQMYW